MTVSSFKEARADNATSGPFLNVDHFAETVRVSPPDGGGAREVVATVRYRHLDDEVEDWGEAETEEIWVACLKDEAAEKGGIGRPSTGYALWRADDEPDEAWSFQGRIQNETPHGWELLFGRNRPTRYRVTGNV